MYIFNMIEAFHGSRSYLLRVCSVLGTVSIFSLITPNSHFYPSHKISKTSIISFMQKLKSGGGGGTQTVVFFSPTTSYSLLM